MLRPLGPCCPMTETSWMCRRQDLTGAVLTCRYWDAGQKIDMIPQKIGNMSYYVCVIYIYSINTAKYVQTYF